MFFTVLLLQYGKRVLPTRYHMTTPPKINNMYEPDSYNEAHFCVDYSSAGIILYFVVSFATSCEIVREFRNYHLYMFFTNHSTAMTQ